jgi:hypothetical protein
MKGIKGIIFFACHSVISLAVQRTLNGDCVPSHDDPVPIATDTETGFKDTKNPGKTSDYRCFSGVS